MRVTRNKIPQKSSHSWSTTPNLRPRVKAAAQVEREDTVTLTRLISTHLSWTSKLVFRRFVIISSPQARARRRNAERPDSKRRSSRQSNRSTIPLAKERKFQFSLVQCKALLRSLERLFQGWELSVLRKRKIPCRESPAWRNSELPEARPVLLASRSWKSQMKRRKPSRLGQKLPKLSWSQLKRTLSFQRTHLNYLCFQCTQCLRHLMAALLGASGSNPRLTRCATSKRTYTRARITSRGESKWTWREMSSGMDLMTRSSSAALNNT